MRLYPVPVPGTQLRIPGICQWDQLSDYRFNPSPFSLSIDAQSEAYKHRILWRSVWDWLHGEEMVPGNTKW